MDISRRQLAGVILAATTVGQIAAQAPPPSTPQPNDAGLDAARAEQRVRALIIARVTLPTTTEPAFHFKA